MIDELSIAARARMHVTNGHSGGHRPNRKPRQKPRQLIARAVCRLGVAMVALGHRLECYEVNLLGDPEILRPAKAQVK